MTQKYDNLYWLGGFFDGEGYASFSSNSPQIGFVNTNPLAISKALSILNDNGIVAKVNNGRKTSKSSKKIRWDIFIHQSDEAIKAAELLSPYINGKIRQLDLIKEYAKERSNTKEYDKLMQFLNQTSNVLIKDLEVLKQKVDIVGEVNMPTEENVKILKDDFNNISYLTGIIDGEGTVGINKRENKHRNSDRYTPLISLVNTNKEIINKCYSTIINNGIGCHISTRINTKRNRVRWDLLVSGTKRVKNLAQLLMKDSVIKRQQIELIFDYCNQRLHEPKSINDIGEAYKTGIQKLNREQ
jgi:hypothetical protein